MGTTTTNNTTVVDISFGKDTTILPPKPKFTVRTFSVELGVQEWMTLDNAIYAACNYRYDIFEISFVLPTHEVCRLVRHQPNWLMRLFGYKTKWILHEV